MRPLMNMLGVDVVQQLHRQLCHSWLHRLNEIVENNCPLYTT